MEEILEGYLEAAAWIEGLDGDFADVACTHARKDIFTFLDLAGDILADCELDQGQIGHDLWLTRNNHGTGFWDRDYLSETAGEALTNISHEMGEVWAYEGSDSRIYFC